MIEQAEQEATDGTWGSASDLRKADQCPKCQGNDTQEVGTPVITLGFSQAELDKLQIAAAAFDSIEQYLHWLCSPVLEDPDDAFNASPELCPVCGIEVGDSEGLAWCDNCGWHEPFPDQPACSKDPFGGDV
jgi:hypothetical protein